MCKLKIVRDLNFQAENKLNYKNMPIAYINLFVFFSEKGSYSIT